MTADRSSPEIRHPKSDIPLHWCYSKKPSKQQMGRPDETPRGDFYEFGPFSIDVSKRSLFRDSEFVPLTPKVFDTLLVLVEESGRVVTKADLLERVWPQAFVEEGSITQNISVLRKILDPYFDGQTPIVTVPRRG